MLYPTNVCKSYHVVTLRSCVCCFLNTFLVLEKVTDLKGTCCNQMYSAAYINFQLTHACYLFINSHYFNEQ